MMPAGDMEPMLFAADAGAAMEPSGSMEMMPLWVLIPYTALMISLYIGVPIITLVAARKNWNTKKTKEKSVGYCGFWKRVAIHAVDQFLMVLIVPMFFNVYYYLRDGQTIADKIYGAKIVDKSTHKTAEVGRLFIRMLGKLFSTIALGVGYWPAGWRAQKNAWHDSWSDTRYISTKKTLGIWVVLPIVLGGVAIFGLLLLPLIIAANAGFNEALMQAAAQ